MLGRSMTQIAKLSEQIGATVLIDGDMIHVGESETGLLQAIGDGLRRKPSPMLDASEALFLGCGDKLPVANSAADESP